MRNRSIKLMALYAILSLPLLVFFQNCGQPNALTLTDTSSNSSKSSLINTVDLPVGTTIIDQTNSASEGLLDDKDQISIGNTQVNPEIENETDIAQAKADCDALSNSTASNNTIGAGVVSEDKKSITGLRGKHTLSSADFGGNSRIDSISNSFGKLTLCGLDVKKVTHSGGKLILMQNSNIDNVDSFYGEISIAEQVNVQIENSKVRIYKK